MSVTRRNIRQRIGGIGFCDDILISTTTSAGAGGGTTLIDATLPHSTNHFNGGELYITSGTRENDYRWVSAFASGGTFTAQSAFGGQIASGVTYECHRFIPAVGEGSTKGKNGAINEALRLAAPRWGKVIRNTSLSFLASTYSYSVASFTVAVDRELGIESVWYDTGEGTTGYKWQIIPDDLWYFDDVDGTPTLQFEDDASKYLTVGRTIRVVYRQPPPALTADTSTNGTLIPDSRTLYDWVCYKATQILAEMMAVEKNEGKNGRWGNLAGKMILEQQKIEASGQEPQYGKIITPTFGIESGAGYYEPVPGRIRIP